MIVSITDKVPSAKDTAERLGRAMSSSPIYFSTSKLAEYNLSSWISKSLTTQKASEEGVDVLFNPRSANEKDVIFYRLLGESINTNKESLEDIVEGNNELVNASPNKEIILRTAKYIIDVIPLQHSVDAVGSVVGSITDDIIFTKDGDMIRSFKTPRLSHLVTGRMQTSEPNIMGMKREFMDVIAPPPGYTLLYSDTNQVDPRIYFSWKIQDKLMQEFIKRYDDAYYGVFHFIHLSEEEDRELRKDFSKIQLLPVDKEKRNGLKRIINAGNYGSKNLNKFGTEDLQNLYQTKIINHKDNIQNEEEIKRMIRDKEKFCKTAFGTLIPIPTTDSMGHSEIRRKIISYSIQGTAADLTRLSVNKALDICDKYNGDAKLALWNHDAFYVYVKEDREDIIEQFIDLNSYEIEGWLPITSSFERR